MSIVLVTTSSTIYFFEIVSKYLISVFL